MASKEMTVKAGQFYKGPAQRGRYRYVEIVMVRRPYENPYAIVYEVDRRGARRSGRSSSGLLRSSPFVIQLTWQMARKVWRMPSWYKRHVVEVSSV